MLRKAIAILLLIYGFACVVSLIIATIGVFELFDVEPDPLTAVFAIALAMPWVGVMPAVSGDGAELTNLALIVVCMSVNASVLLTALRILR